MHMLLKPRLLLTLGFLVSFSAHAHAQLGFLDKVFSNVTDINGSLQYGRPIGDDPVITDSSSGLGLRGIGFEVSFSAGDIWRPEPPKICDSLKKETSEAKQVEVHHTGKIVTDSVRILSITGSEIPDSQAKINHCSPKGVTAELALGYSQLTGYTGKSLDFRGGLEELPSVSLYAQYETGLWIDPYLGVRAGLVQLKSARAFVPDSTLFTAAGSTYEIGIAPGLVVGNPKRDWGLFIEASWLYRKFHNVDWTNSKQVAVPSILRGSLNLSTFILAFGGQIGIGSEPDQ
jgi:hypothetical protein